MRVAVIHNLPPGGARRRLAAQMAHMTEVEIAEICPATAAPIRDDATVVPGVQRAPNVPRWRRPPLRYTDLGSLLAAWRRVAREIARSGAAVVYANPCRFAQAPPALLWAALPSLYFCDEPRRVDVEVGGSASRNPLTRGPYGPLHAVERRLDRAATARAARIATNSRYTAGTIASAYGREADVVPMGVDEHFAPNGKSGARHLLSVGMLTSAKGHDLVLEAAAQTGHRRPVLIVTPRAKPADAAALQARAAGLGVELEIRTNVSDSDLREAYRAAFATLYLARREPLGLVSLEAQACGSPVIVAAEGGLPETVEHGVSGWTVERRPELVAARLDELEDPSRRSALVAGAAARGAGLSWAQSAERIVGLLRETVAQAERRSAA